MLFLILLICESAFTNITDISTLSTDRSSLKFICDFETKLSCKKSPIDSLCQKCGNIILLCLFFHSLWIIIGWIQKFTVNFEYL